MSLELMLIRTADMAFRPATQADMERAQKLKIGREYGCKLTELRNGKFHRKLFALLEYLYDALPRHTAIYEGRVCEQSFKSFRKMMVAMAGYYEMVVATDGRMRAEADSISYGECSQEKVEAIYSDVIDKALSMMGNDQTRKDLDEIVENVLRFA